MDNDPRVDQLLEEIVASGRSPEDVCRECVELLPAVQESLRRLRAVEAEIAVLFPTHAPKQIDQQDSNGSAGMALPDIPGYTVLNVLGHGGMGVVYKARHLKLDRVVAVKMLLAGGFAAPAELGRFMREARVLAGIQHPHIVQVYDTGDLQGRPYFTMEYVDGGSLAQRLAGEPQTAKECADLVATLADAVHVAHAGGIVHRDLKPANILLTSDGTPKISDFGLARWYEGGSDLTLGGARLGTPSYMSPEQAIGRDGTIGPSTDIFSLGAVLYEVLTGRPPFRGSSVAETERQLLHDDPIAPRLLNARVPRDLEVICLKCLHKSPGSRYMSAQSLAEDLRRFQSGEPIHARPVGVAERTVKWARRSPAKAGLLFAGILATLIASGATLWTLSARASRIAAVEGDLSIAVERSHQGAWREAKSALDRAIVRLGDGGPSELRSRIEGTTANLALVDRLDSIRLLRATTDDGVLNDERAAREYADAFLAAGLGTFGDTPATVADRIGNTAISSVLVGALDDWALASKDPAQRSWLDEVVRRADRDNDPDGWRRSARDSARWTTRESIVRLADDAPVNVQPITFLYAFSEALNGAGVDAVRFLARAQQAHPDDFWLTSAMGNALSRNNRHTDAVGYYRAAVALRPDTMVSHHNLGQALSKIGLHDEAMTCFRTAIERDPGAVDPLKHLGLALSNAGRHQEALKTYLRAVETEAEDSLLHLEMSWTYAQLGRYQDAELSYHRSLEFSKEKWYDRPGTKSFVIKQGRHDLGMSMWQKQLEIRPTDLAAWDGYAELCLFGEDVSEYEYARGQLLDRFGNTSDPNACERLGRACLLLPPSSPEQLKRATALIDRALTSPAMKGTWAYPYFRFARALADYREGDYRGAAVIVEGESAGILGPAPRLVASMCRARLGESTLARQQLAEAVISFDWAISRADNREAWIYHVLRREAERLVLPDLDRQVRGESEPDDTNTRLALLGVCQSAERYGRCAQLWTAVLHGQSSTPQKFSEPAARALVFAGSGAGVDACDYSDVDRAAWRDLGLRTLSARLDELARDLRSGVITADAVRNTIAGWETAREFGSVRDTPLLGSLQDTERARWALIWSRARAAAGLAEPARP